MPASANIRDRRQPSAVRAERLPIHRRDSSAAGGSHDANLNRRHQRIINIGEKSPNSPSERPATSGRFLDRPKRS